MKLRHKIAFFTFLLGTALLVILSTIFYHFSKITDIEHAFELSHSIIHEHISDIELLLVEEANKTLSLSRNPFIIHPVLESNIIFSQLSDRERNQSIEDTETQWIATMDPDNPFFNEYLANPISDYLQTYIDTDPEKYGEIFITNRFGLIVAASNRTSNYNQLDEDWWQNCFQTGKVYFDDRGYDLSVGDYVIGISIPVKEDNEVIGIIKCNLRAITLIQTVLAEHYHMDELRTLVARSGGLILFDSENPYVYYNETISPLLLATFETSSVGNIVIDNEDGGKLLATFSVVPITTGRSEYGFGGILTSYDHWLGNENEYWYVIHLLPMDTAIATTKNNTIHLIQVGIIFILLIAVVTIIATRSLTGPIKRLISYTRKIGQGDFEADLPVAVDDEIGSLAKSFNQMALNLQHTMISRDLLAEEVERRKTIETALRESETRFRELFNNMRSGVAVYEPVEDGVDFILKDLNNAGQQMSKISKTAIIGKRVTEAFPGVEELGLLDVLRNVNHTGKPAWLPLKLYQDNRLTEWVENYVYRLPSGDIIAVYEDKTGQKQAEAVIERIFDLSPDLICTAGFDGYFKKINPAFTTLLGYPEEMLLDQPFINLVHPDDVKSTERIMAEKLTSGISVFNFQNRYLRKDGSYIWISWTSASVTDEKLIYAIGRDVTESKLAEEKIIELARFPEDNTNPVMRISDDGTVIYANKASECLLDCWQTNVEGILPDTIRSAALSALDSGMAQYLDTVCNDKTYKLSLVPVVTSGFINIYAMDITDRIKVEQALKDSEEKFRVISEQSLMGIGISQDYQLLYVNKAFADIFELPQDDPDLFDFTIIQQYFHPDDRAFILEQVQKMQAGETEGIVSEYSYRLVTPGGTIKWIEMHSKVIMYGNKPADLMAMLDITDRKQLEDQIIQAQKMESVGRLAGGIAHDFNNMLTAIIGNAELALTTVPPDSELEDDINDIKSTAERAANLTRQLLAFSRRQIVEPKVLNLNSVLPDLDRMLKRLIGEHIELNTILGNDLWAIKIDPGQINQILTNLVVNARDAIPEKGVITIETANIVIDNNYIGSHANTKPGKYVMLAVSDTGIGMDKETKSRIFEPFFTTKGKERGTGLGLSTCYGIVKQNKGNIWAYSEPGHGTTIKVYLPRAHESALQPDMVPSLPVSTGGTETILVVEDEPAVRKMIVRTLTEQGYRIIEAANGQEALTVADTTEKIDLLITDMIMPIIGGRELAEKLTIMKPDLKIIFISGYTDNSIVHQGFLETGIHFLQKPFYPALLLRKIRQVLDSTY